MRWLPGQAARRLGVILYRLAAVVIVLVALASAGVAVLAWRLSQGPLELPWLAGRLEAAVNSRGSTKVTIGSIALRWEGFRSGVDRPLDLQAINVVATDAGGERRLVIPRAEVSLSLRALLLARVEPRAIELDQPNLTLVRAADGTISLDLSGSAANADMGAVPSPEPADKSTPIADLLEELAQPPTTDRGQPREALLSQLTHLRIRDARITLIDQRLGVTWRIAQAALDVTREQQGGMTASAELAVTLGQQEARFSAAATLAVGAAETHLRVRMAPVAPSALAQAVPRFGWLAALDAAVSGEAEADLAHDLSLRQGRLTLHAGAGQLTIAQGSLSLLDAAMVMSATRETMSLETAQIRLLGHPDGPPTLLQAQGTAQRSADQMSASLSLDLDQLDIADLARVWPQGLGGAARAWVVENITAGIARNGHLDVGLAASNDALESVKITHIGGTIDASGCRVFWLRPIPPIENAQGQLRVLDPDTLEISVTSGRQKLRGQSDSAAGGLALRNGRLRFTGLAQQDQAMTIDTEIAGSLPDAISLLREPRLKLFDQQRLDLKNPSGQASVQLSLGLPLVPDIKPDMVSVHAVAHLDGVHLGGVAAGRDLDQGVLDLDVTKSGLKVTGKGLLAAIPARIDGTVDFRPGPPTQIVQSVTVSGMADTVQLKAAGLDFGGLASGVLGLKAVLTERRNGQGELAVTADLGKAELDLPELAWRKPIDTPATASAKVVTERDRLVRIDAIQVTGYALQVEGNADCTAGRISTLHIDRLVLGQTIAQGTVQFPAGTGGAPIVASITGAVIDLSERLNRRRAGRPASSDASSGLTPAWTIDAKFERALMAQNRVFHTVSLHAEDDGRLLRRLQIEGQTAGRASISVEITPYQSVRRVNVSAGDAGELLSGLDIVHTMQGGRLSVKGTFDDTQPGRPLVGSANIDDFRIRDAPALAKLLQAMTLYGLVELMRGPGLGFNQLIAPFRLSDDVIELNDARAFSSSLGVTAKGRVDLNAEQINMTGTIVPAYFFNSLLGNVPLVGKLFSPERGGGVFAASYSLSGPLLDPDVSVNPLAALTPGFLRGIFGIF